MREWPGLRWHGKREFEISPNMHIVLVLNYPDENLMFEQSMPQQTKQRTAKPPHSVRTILMRNKLIKGHGAAQHENRMK